MLEINGVKVVSPSSMTWGLQDLSSDASGRTLDGMMHKDIIAQKRKLDCVWNGLNQADTATLLTAINQGAFMSIRYPDAMSGQNETRTFYVGDRSAPVLMWSNTAKVFASVSFNFVER